MPQLETLIQPDDVLNRSAFKAILDEYGTVLSKCTVNCYRGVIKYTCHPETDFKKIQQGIQDGDPLEDLSSTQSIDVEFTATVGVDKIPNLRQEIYEGQTGKIGALKTPLINLPSITHFIASHNTELSAILKGLKTTKKYRVSPTVFLDVEYANSNIPSDFINLKMSVNIWQN